MGHPVVKVEVKVLRMMEACSIISLSLSGVLRSAVFVVVTLSSFVMSSLEDTFFSDLDGSSCLFLDDEELNPEDETVMVDGSAVLLDCSILVMGWNGS